MACPFGNLSFHIDAGARLYGSLRRSAIRGQAFLRRSCAVTECGCACPVISFHGCAPFPASAKVRSYTLRIPRLHSCAAAGKPIAGTASAVRNALPPCGRNSLLQSEAHKGFLILLAVPRSENVFDYSYLAVLLGIGVLNR